jgi:hypothetical protein
MPLGKEAEDTLFSGEILRSLCNDCANLFMAQHGMPLEHFINGFTVPVIVMAQNGSVGMANGRAHTLLGKAHGQIAGRQGGDVFECEHAAEPEGCGKTVHCSGCTIRRAVMDTMQTGEPHVRVPASLKVGKADDAQPLAMQISTQKILGFVLLKVEKIAIDRHATPP